MTNLTPMISEEALNHALDQASPVPAMPMAGLEAAAMEAFTPNRGVLHSWPARFGAIAATVVLGVGGFMAVQSYQSHQETLMADADAFAEQLLADNY